MDFFQTYFHQPVTFEEWIAINRAIEASALSSETDKSQFGILSGFVVGPTVGPSFNVLVSAGVGIDKAGHRLFSGAPITQDISVDTLGNPTVPSVGNRKWISVYARFGRDLSDPRSDGPPTIIGSLFYKHAEALNSGDGTDTPSPSDPTAPTTDVQLNVGSLLVIQGSEDLITNPEPTRPALSTNSILLADILYTDGDANFTISQISTARAERFGLRFNFTPPDATELHGADDTGAKYDLIMELPQDTTGNMKTRIYSSTGGLVITSNAKWSPADRIWVPDLGSTMGKTQIDSVGIRVQSSGGSSHADNAWDTEFDLLADGGVGTLSVLSTSGVFTQKGTTHSFASLDFIADGTPSIIGTGFTFQTAFPSTPSSVTITTVGSDLNVAVAQAVADNQYGGHYQILPTNPNGHTRGRRSITAVF